jgi:hypothetical protein
MRDELIAVLDHFAQPNVDILQLRVQIYSMLKNGVEAELRPAERAALNDFFSSYLDMFDPNLPRRSGLFGRARDLLDQVFRGRYHLSVATLRSRADELRVLLTR